MIPLRDSIRTRSWPIVTIALIGLNVWVFLHQLTLGPLMLQPFMRHWGLVPGRYFALAATDPADWAAIFLPFFTSMFLHGGVLHIVSNMWFLWIFGDSLEDALGHLRFFLFYVLAGFAAGWVHVQLNAESFIPTVGASGAISGVLGGYLLLFPRAHVLTLVPLVFIFFTVIELPVILYLGFWFLLQLFAGTAALAAQGTNEGVAWWAHVGGFVAGLILVPFFRRRRRYHRAFASPYSR